ncbi:hypothetical protein BT96DRAFT_1004242 [Gymnopus androsaceus JB14]|uniref:Uncharacterized protein n=1 Tax=Gymnopus androsaceus JB14 TaxID=1447944 RepID=A0A6A4GT63_9AGAR|nr:hypothetical protein BT96DRAFT_1004242 [Gymnopus androsaceus JB14]
MGWQGVRKMGYEEYQGLTREETIALPWMHYLYWDGSHNVVVCDRARRGIVHLIGAPQDPNWPKVHAEAARVIDKGREACKFNSGQVNHIRGAFPAEAIGYSHGGGQIEPSNTQHSVRNLKVLNVILANPAVQHISGIANSAYKCYCPNMYEHFKVNDEALRQWKPSLRQNFPKSVFAATTINFGPETITNIHVDSRNSAPASCAVTSLGPFNSHHGGEIVLWNLGLIVRFPPGCTLLLPSALIVHLNLAIQPGEQRFSITQYSAATLSRFVENGFCNDVDILDGSDSTAKEALLSACKTRWKKALDCYRVW